MTAEFNFRATDAFLYVDTYRREILHPVARVQADLKRVEERPNGAALSPSRYFAELRALQHALQFVLKREEPGMVVLGEGGEDSTAVDAKTGAVKSARQLATDLQRCEEHGETLEVALKQVKARERELQGEIASRQQQIERMNLRLANSQSTITVLGVTLGVTGLVLVLVLFF